jgi:hypothetical protein
MTHSPLNTRLRTLAAVGLILGPLAALAGAQPPADSSRLLVGEDFEQLRDWIRPQPGESRWMEIPWQIDLHEARRKAAAEGKPLFVLSGGGATAIGPC